MPSLKGNVPKELQSQVAYKFVSIADIYIRITSEEDCTRCVVDNPTSVDLGSFEQY